MKRYSTVVLFALLAVGLIFVGVTMAQKMHKAVKTEKAEAKYPENYRYWTHVKSMVILPGHELHDTFGGIHHIYANKPALKAMVGGRHFPNGAVLVFDLYEAREEGGALVEGAHKMVAIMEKSDKKYASTGGWGFEGYRGDTRERAVEDAGRECFSCHEAQRAGDYVFSKFRP
ncbi:MAG TPA: cytochrome P460 family protein [bacterium]|jgi:hypothetical protein